MSTDWRSQVRVAIHQDVVKHEWGELEDFIVEKMEALGKNIDDRSLSAITIRNTMKAMLEDGIREQTTKGVSDRLLVWGKAFDVVTLAWRDSLLSEEAKNSADKVLEDFRRKHLMLSGERMGLARVAANGVQDFFNVRLTGKFLDRRDSRDTELRNSDGSLIIGRL